MQGQQDHQPQLFSMVQIEKLVPESHLLRKVDQVLDLNFVREQTKEFYCANNGRPSVDPEVFIRILLIMYLYNVRSDRQVCEELQFNLAYRWFCKLSLEDKVPDHSSLTRIRDRLGEKTFKKIFDRIVKLCLEKGLATGEKVMMDGSLIDANASLYSLIPKEEFEQRTELEKASGKRQKHRKRHILGEKISNKTHVSTSDADARLAGK